MTSLMERGRSWEPRLREFPAISVVPGQFVINDLMHWQTTLVTRTIDSTARRLFTGKFALVSPGVVALAQGHLGFAKGLLARDPDGHAMRIIEP